MTHPLTPREKVAAAIIDSGVNIGTSTWPDDIQVDALRLSDAILTALASGSGDHAELAKEIERTSFWREARDSRDFVIDEPCDADDYGAEERPVYADWFRRSVLALLAEIAALRARLDAEATSHVSAKRQLAAEYNRATEAERKLAEAVGLLRRIEGMRPATCEASLAHDMAQLASEWLSKEAERG